MCNIDLLDYIKLILQQESPFILGIDSVSRWQRAHLLELLLLLGLLDTTGAHWDTLTARVADLGRDETLDLVYLAESATAELLDLLKHGPVALHGLGLVRRAAGLSVARGGILGLLTGIVGLLSTC